MDIREKKIWAEFGERFFYCKSKSALLIWMVGTSLSLLALILKRRTWSDPYGSAGDISSIIKGLHSRSSPCHWLSTNQSPLPSPTVPAEVTLELNTQQWHTLREKSSQDSGQCGGDKNQKIKLKAATIQHNLSETQSHTCPKRPALYESERSLKWDYPRYSVSAYLQISGTGHTRYLTHTCFVTLLHTHSNCSPKHAMTENQASTEVSENLSPTCFSYWAMAFTAEHGQSHLIWDV